MKNLELIISESNIPDYINDDVSTWKIGKEDSEHIYLYPDFGEIQPCIGQPFLLVIDRKQSLGNLFFLGTPEWNELNLDAVYKEISD
ncbi:hypothetical protein [Enterococcus avium]|uniref:hypothetical protein n=1 Tax=Enterococcus avium TaxID=33945 RepID=UPI00321BAC26